MRQLELAPAAAEKAEWFDLAIVAAEMCWPAPCGSDGKLSATMRELRDRNARQREKFVQAVGLVNLRDRAEDGEHLPHDAVVAVLQRVTAPDYQPLEVLQRETKTAQVHGVAAGRYLINSIALARLYGRANMAYAEQMLRDAVARSQKPTKPTPKQLIPYAGAPVRKVVVKVQREKEPLPRQSFYNQAWTPFRGVCHFWAAHIDVGLKSKSIPCTTDELTDFMCLAEAYRVAGENSKNARGEPVLRPNDSVRIPDFFLRSKRFELVFRKP